jgi:5-methylcytosine-specific restriction protein A
MRLQLATVTLTRNSARWEGALSATKRCGREEQEQMPQRSLRPCPHPGCPNLVRQGRCSKHSAQHKKAKAFRGTDNDRPSFARRGYTRAWASARLAWLRQHPLCGDRVGGRFPEHSSCTREGRAVEAGVVDHIRRHEGNLELFWDEGNWQSLCTRCHAVKTSMEMNAVRQAASKRK